jgi:DNA polymerase V
MLSKILRCGVLLPILSAKPKRVLLVDCNNFFVSCERVFNPTLIGKPVVVLSNNDGCVIARSQEAKALGVPMGAPAFKWLEFFKKHHVHVFSSNFALYGDMSSRVMQTLSSEATDIEVYSVDEAFIHLADYGNEDNDLYYAARAQLLMRKVKQHTGIPISIGIAPTKTLAKIANKMAKKNDPLGGYYDITNSADIDDLLEQVPIGDVWGIGRRYGRFLSARKITTARALKYAPDAWVRKNLTIVGLKTVYELRAIACLAIDESVEDNKSFTVSRSFGKAVTDINHLYESVATHATAGALKLRKQKSAVRYVSVFLLNNKYHDIQNYFHSAGIELLQASSYTPDIISAAKKCVDKLYKPGSVYKKAGIILADISGQAHIQIHMLAPDRNATKQRDIMQACDRITYKWGSEKLTFAATGITRPWQTKREKKSPSFTTNWDEILTI